MEKKVKKRNGEVEPFIKEKLVTSVQKTGASVEDARRIADEIKEETGEVVNTEELREKALQKLGKVKKEFVENWQKYDRAVKKRI